MLNRFAIRALLVALPLLLLAACGDDKGAQAKPNGNAAERPIPVTTQVVQASAWNDTLLFIWEPRSRVPRCSTRSEGCSSVWANP